MLGQNRLASAAHVHDDVPRLDSLDGDGEHLADLVGELSEKQIALGFAQALEDDLLGGLRGDAPGAVRDALGGDDLVQARVGVDGAGGVEVNLRHRVFHALDDGHEGVDGDVAGHGVEFDGYVFAVRDRVFAIRGGERRLDCGYDYLARQAALGGQLGQSDDEIALHCSATSCIPAEPRRRSNKESGLPPTSRRIAKAMVLLSMR